MTTSALNGMRRLAEARAAARPRTLCGRCAWKRICARMEKGTDTSCPCYQRKEVTA